MTTELPPPTRITTCSMCGGQVERARVYLFGREMFCDARCLCPPCAAAYEQQEASEKAQRAWEALVAHRMPGDYRGADTAKVPAAFAPALTWDASRARGGIGLVGPCGCGKSHALACVVMLRRQPFLWWSGTEARDAAIDAASADKDRAGCRERWEHAMRVPVLVLDDVSQGKMTEAWSASLFDLLETRLSRSRPVLWTSQIALAGVRAKIARQNGGDEAQADAIARRLGQHSLILTA